MVFHVLQADSRPSCPKCSWIAQLPCEQHSGWSTTLLLLAEKLFVRFWSRLPISAIILSSSSTTLLNASGVSTKCLLCCPIHFARFVLRLDADAITKPTIPMPMPMTIFYGVFVVQWSSPWKFCLPTFPFHTIN